MTSCSGRWITSIASPPAMKPGTTHAQICTGPGGLSERLEPPDLADPATKRGTRNPRAGDLNDHGVADPPPLTEQRGVHVDALGRQVLAEEPVAQLAVQAHLPVVEILAGERVQRLIRTAVIAPVADVIADESAAQTGLLRSGIADLDRAAGRPLVDAGGVGLLVRVGDRATDVDGRDPRRRGHGSPRSVASRRAISAASRTASAVAPR